MTYRFPALFRPPVPLLAPLASLMLPLVLALSLLLPAEAMAQAQPQGEAQGQSLGSAANDPTASVTSYLFQDFYTSNHYGLNDTDANYLQFRSAIPYRLGGTSNIFRITLPYQTDTAAGRSGWSDITVFNLTTFNRPWGRFGVGAVALLPTGRDGISAEKWGIGPAAGFVAQQPWGVWGLFNQNIFTVDGGGRHPDVNISILQPLVTYKLTDAWSVGASDMSITYDWDGDEFVSLPLGLQLNRLARFGTTAVQFSASYEHNFKDKTGVGRDTFGLTAKLLVPN